MKHVSLKVLGAIAFFGMLTSGHAKALGYPVTNLPAHFNANGISFTGPHQYIGNTSSASDNRFFSYPDPADNETIGVFFELETRSALSDDVHFAVLLRGPTTMDQHRGRGLAIGKLASHQGCDASVHNGRGVFIENFSAENTELIQGPLTGPADPVAFNHG